MPSEYRMKRHEKVMAALAGKILQKRLQESDEKMD